MMVISSRKMEEHNSENGILKELKVFSDINIWESMDSMLMFACMWFLNLN